jgi:hypothetical protein
VFCEDNSESRLMTDLFLQWSLHINTEESAASFIRNWWDKTNRPICNETRLCWPPVIPLKSSQFAENVVKLFHLWLQWLHTELLYLVTFDVKPSGALYFVSHPVTTEHPIHILSINGSEMNVRDYFYFMFGQKWKIRQASGQTAEQDG